MNWLLLARLLCERDGLTPRDVANMTFDQIYLLAVDHKAMGDMRRRRRVTGSIEELAEMGIFPKLPLSATQFLEMQKQKRSAMKRRQKKARRKERAAEIEAYQAARGVPRSD